MGPAPDDLAAPLSPRAVRARLDALGRGARKRLGQHFLSDRHVAERIHRTAALSGGEPVIEIGPGIGALSDALAASSQRLWLVELDREFAALAREHFAGRDAVTVVEADALDLDFGQLLGADAPAVVVANLPYNVGTAILSRLLVNPSLFSRMVLMVQLEVAQRLVAPPGSKTYGILSVMTQVAAEARIAFQVPPTAFVPRPKVESAVVCVTPRCAPPVPIGDPSVFRQVVRAAFGQRRKHLANSLRSVSPNPRALLDAAGIDPTRRPETLSLAEFAAISNAVAA